MTQSSPSPEAPSLDELRAVAARQGVTVEDADLEGVLGFLEVVLPQLREIEQRVPPETPA